MNDEMWIVFPLNPEPWAIGEAYPMRRGGKMSAGISPNGQLVAYKESVREHIEKTLGIEQKNFVFEKGTKLKLTGYFWRQRAEYLTHQGRTARKHEIDATNALKAIEDAFQGYLYHNDKDNLDVRSVMVTQDPDVTHPKILVHLERYVGFDTSEIPTEIWKELERAYPNFDLG